MSTPDTITLSRPDAKLLILLIDGKLEGIFEHPIAELRAKAVALVGEPGPEAEYHDYAGMSTPEHPSVERYRRYNERPVGYVPNALDHAVSRILRDALYRAPESEVMRIIADHSRIKAVLEAGNLLGTDKLGNRP